MPGAQFGPVKAEVLFCQNQCFVLEDSAFMFLEFISFSQWVFAVSFLYLSLSRFFLHPSPKTSFVLELDWSDLVTPENQLLDTQNCEPLVAWNWKCSYCGNGKASVVHSLSQTGFPAYFYLKALFFFIKFTLFLLCMYVHVYRYLYSQIPWTTVTGGCAPWCRCWKPDLGPLLLPAQPSLKAHLKIFLISIIKLNY